MKIKISALDIKAARAIPLFSAIAEAHIREAHGEPTVRPIPTGEALSVYGEAVRQLETESDMRAELEESGD